MKSAPKVHAGGRVAGVLLLVMAMLTVPYEVLSPEDPARWVNLGFAVVDVWLGLSLACGSARWLRLTQVRLVASFLICVPIYFAAKREAWGFLSELWCLVGMGLLLVGTPTRRRIGFGIGLLAPVMLMMGIGLGMKARGEAPFIESLTGKAFAYRLQLPAGRWQSMAELVLLDRFVGTKSGCTVAAMANAKSKESLDQLVSRELNTAAVFPGHAILSEPKPLETHVGIGKVAEEKNDIQKCRDAYYVKNGHSLWLSGCASAEQFEGCRADFDAIFASVEMP